MIAGPSGLPSALVADGVRREVTAIRDDWLVQDRWWTDEPVDRHYFELLVEPGTVTTVYYDARAGAWYTHAPNTGRGARRAA